MSFPPPEPEGITKLRFLLTQCFYHRTHGFVLDQGVKRGFGEKGEEIRHRGGV